MYVTSEAVMKCLVAPCVEGSPTSPLLSWGNNMSQHFRAHALHSAHTHTQIAKHIITNTDADTGLPAVILALAAVKSAWCIQWLRWNMCTGQKMKLHYGHWVHTGWFKQFFLISSVKKIEGLYTNRDVVSQNSERAYGYLIGLFSLQYLAGHSCVLFCKCT